MSYTFSVAGLPPGLSLVGRQILGTPSAPGNYTVTVTVSDGVSSVSETVGVTIAAVPAPIPFWQLILSAESGCYSSDSALLQQPALIAESGSYWRDQVTTQTAVIASSGSYWRDQVSAGLTAEAGSYWRDQVIAALTPEAGSYWRDSATVSSPTSPSAYWNLTSNGNAAVGTPNLTAGIGVSFSSGAYAALDGNSGATLTGDDTADISIGNAAFTWCTWVYLNSNSTYFLLNKGFVSGTDYPSAIFEYILYYDASAGRFKWALYDTTNSGVNDVVLADTFGAPSTGAWYFLTTYYKPGSSANEIGISVNNGAFDTHATSINHADTDQNLTLGYRSQDGLNLAGRMRYTGFFKALPSAIDLAYYYNAGAGRSLP